MIQLFERIRAVWRRVFFWQSMPEESREGRLHSHDDHALVLAVTEPNRVPRWKQVRFINRVLTRNERRAFWLALLVFVLAIGTGTFAIFRTSVSDLPAMGGAYTEGVVGSPKLINPLFAPLNDVDRDLSSLVYSGLFRIGPDLEPVPDLADHYRWIDGGKTLEVSLRSDARFHDGEPVTADDVQFTILAAKNPAWRSPLAGVFQNVNVVRVDASTIQFQLNDSDPAFLYDLTLGILPAHVWSDVAPENAALADANLRPIGSGPYRVESFTRDSKGMIIHFDLRRFNGYYGVQPFINEISLRFYTDRGLAEQALKNSQIDGLAFLPWAEADQMKSESIKTYSIQLPLTTVAFFNTKSPLLKDVRMRQALAMAVDPAELSALIGSEKAQAANGPYPFMQNTSTTVPNLEQARASLDKLGWILPEGANVRVQKTTSSTASSTMLAIRIDVPDQPDLLRVADLLKRRWSLLGAQVDVKSGDAESLYRNALSVRDATVVLSDMLLLPDQDLTPFFGSAYSAGSTGRNFSGLADRDVDTALAAVQNATSSEALLTARKTAADLLQNRLPALFLLRPTYAYAISSGVQGVEDLQILEPDDRFDTLDHWFVRTRFGWKD